MWPFFSPCEILYNEPLKIRSVLPTISASCAQSMLKGSLSSTPNRIVSLGYRKRIDPG